jgi:hypothetical protein
MKVSIVAKVILLGSFLLSAAACVPTTTSNQGNTPDGMLTSYVIYAKYPNGKTFQTLLIKDNRTGAFELKISAEGETLSRALLLNILSPGVLPALISGAAGIQIAKDGSCGEGVCGTIIYTTAVSGSEANAGANAEANAGVEGKPHYSSKNFTGPDPLYSMSKKDALEVLVDFHGLSNDQAKAVYDIGTNLMKQL